MMNWLMLAQGADGGESGAGAGDKINEAGKQVQDAGAKLLEGDTSAATDLMMQYGPKLLGAIVIIIVTFIAGKMIAGMVRRTAEKAKIDLTLSRFFGKMVYYLVLIVGGMFALSLFGIEVTSFAAILAAAGFAIGMALSGTLSNFAAGAMLLIFRPFKVGDVVEAGGVLGIVDAIELFTTSINTFENQRYIVPNSSIYGGVIKNITYHSERRVDVPVGVEYSADIDKTREVLQAAADSLGDLVVKGEGRGTFIWLDSLGDSSVNWQVRVWAKGSDFGNAKQALTRAVKMHLDEAGIGIPFPQMDVHLDKVGA